MSFIQKAHVTFSKIHALNNHKYLIFNKMQLHIDNYMPYKRM